MAYKPKLLNPTEGGTGIANASSSTITLGGALVTSGAFASTFTMTNITGVTFPTSGTLATTAQLPSITATQYDVLVGGAANAIGSVGPGSSGQYLQSGGNAANPAYSTATLPSTATGTGKVLIADGTNWVASTPTFPNASATTRKIIVSDGTNWVASTETYAVPGTSGNLMTSDGTNWTSAAGATYTSGTFTPVLNFGGGVTGITYATQTGKYVQVGKIVFIYINIQLSSKGSSSGAAAITGLPVNSDGGANILPLLYFSGLTLTALYTNVSTYTSAVTTLTLLQSGSAQSATTIADTGFSNSTNLIFNGWYFSA